MDKIKEGIIIGLLIGILAVGIVLMIDTVSEVQNQSSQNISNVSQSDRVNDPNSGIESNINGVDNSVSKNSSGIYPEDNIIINKSSIDQKPDSKIDG